MDPTPPRNSLTFCASLVVGPWSFPKFPSRLVLSPPIANSRLAHSLFLKLPQSNRQQQNIDEAQHEEDRREREMRNLRHQSGAQAFAGIHERVDQYGLLQDWKTLQRTPGKISA